MYVYRIPENGYCSYGGPSRYGYCPGYYSPSPYYCDPYYSPSYCAPQPVYCDPTPPQRNLICCEPAPIAAIEPCEPARTFEPCLPIPVLEPCEPVRVVEPCVPAPVLEPCEPVRIVEPCVPTPVVEPCEPVRVITPIKAPISKYTTDIAIYRLLQHAC